MTRSGTNRPFKYGARDRREYLVWDCEVALRVEYDANENAIYIGKAKVGTLDAEDKWQISLQTYDANNNVTHRTWPQNDEGNASSEFEFVWNDRAGYTYS